MFRTSYRVACISIAIAAMLGCVSGPTGAAIEMIPGSATPMRPGERARLPDRSHLAYVGLRSDSRCPADVTCIHAGWAELDFVYESAAGSRQALVLSTRAGIPPVDAGGWRFEITEVGRGASPVAQVRASRAGD